LTHSKFSTFTFRVPHTMATENVEPLETLGLVRGEIALVCRVEAMETLQHIVESHK
jgi:hypothetical protein